MENTEKTKKESTEILETINSLFGKLYKYNFLLLAKSNDITKGYTGEEVFDFFITSHGQSFLKSIYFGHVESKGLMLNCRCIIEGFAIKEMIKRGEITDKQLELLKYQDGLIEKRHYQKFADIAPEAMFPKQMDENYVFCKNEFRKILKEDFTSKEIEAIINSNIPFLCNKNVVFTQLVEKYLGADLAKIYKMLSLIVHPNPNFEFSQEFTAQAIAVGIKLLEQEYSSFNSGGYTLQEHFAITTSSYESNKFINAIHKIASAFENIKNDFIKNFGDNYVSNTMHSISMILQEITLDRLFGFQEQVKCKIKPLIEIIASFYKNYLCETDVDNRYKLLLEHVRLKVSNVSDQEYLFENAYSIYKKLYENGISLDDFKKAFLAPTGYSINEKGLSASINSMVRDVAKIIKHNDNQLTFSDTLMIDYVESQMLSHANGYMWFSNSGAFCDTNNILLEILQLLVTIFEYLKVFFANGFNETKEYKYRKTSNIFRDAIIEIHNDLKTIDKLQKKPMIFLDK